MIIVDCTVLVDFYAGEDPYREAAYRLLNQDSEWISVGLWRYEFGNVLLRYVRAGRLTAEAMEMALQSAEKLIVESVHEIECNDIWSIALEKELSYYDASYVWLARLKQIPLYTRDAAVLKKCSEYCCAMPN